MLVVSRRVEEMGKVVRDGDRWVEVVSGAKTSCLGRRRMSCWWKLKGQADSRPWREGMSG